MSDLVASESPGYVWDPDIGGTPLRHKCDMLDQHKGSKGWAAEMGDHDGPLALA
jgi:hypothetical protein